MNPRLELKYNYATSQWGCHLTPFPSAGQGSKLKWAPFPGRG